MSRVDQLGYKRPWFGRGVDGSVALPAMGDAMVAAELKRVENVMQKLGDVLSWALVALMFVAVAVAARGFILWRFEWWPGDWGWGFRAFVMFLLFAVVKVAVDDD